MDKKRLFDTELRMMLPQDCLKTVTTNGTYTVLVLSETQINIDDELMESAEAVHTKALSRNKNAHKRLATDNISQLYHVRKKQNAKIFIPKTSFFFSQKSSGDAG